MQGETLGSYRILDKLGEGGMGTVYLAEHSLIGRKAAVKVLLPELSQNPEIVTRFFNEARASTAIAHPGIVQAFDFGHHRDGSAFIVMELLVGESLEDRLKRQNELAEGEAARITRHSASALAAAHDAGIIHRDLKPGNIFLCTDPEMEGGERAKILDFGIAKLAGSGDSDFKTRTGSMMGTPVYMSPEQCRGAGEIDHRSDIYSLGCVLFRMVCGRPPFVAQGFGEIIAAHLYQPPPSPRAFAPHLSPQLEAVIQRTLCKSPDERFATMTELAEALRSMGRASSMGVATPPVGIANPGASLPTPAGWGPPSDGAPPVGAPPTGPGPAGHGEPGSHPPGMSPGALTTLGGTASQRMSANGGKRRSHILLAAGSVAAVVAGLVLVLALGGTDDDSVAVQPTQGEPMDAAAELEITDIPETTGVEAGAEQDAGMEMAAAEGPDAALPVMITIESTPSGATVFLAGEDEPLGKTPYQYIALPEPGEVTLKLELDDYRDEVITFAGDQDDVVRLDLKKRRSRERRPRRRNRPNLNADPLLQR